MSFKPYQQRAIDDKEHIDGKIEDLTEMVNSMRFLDFDDAEQRRLGRQEKAMREYSGILGERIAAFVA